MFELIRVSLFGGLLLGMGLAMLLHHDRAAAICGVLAACVVAWCACLDASDAELEDVT